MAKIIEMPTRQSPPKVEKPQLKRDPYPYQGFIDFMGFPIDLENLKGSTRSGVAPDGTKWSTYMNYHYGEIRNTEGSDGDPLDVYVGDNQDSPLVVVIHQHDPDTGKYDEDKVMLGFDSIEEAVGAFKKQYDRPGFYQEGEYTAFPINTLWRWCMDQSAQGKRIKMARRVARAAQSRLGYGVGNISPAMQTYHTNYNLAATMRTKAENMLGDATHLEGQNRLALRKLLPEVGRWVVDSMQRLLVQYGKVSADTTWVPAQGGVKARMHDSEPILIEVEYPNQLSAVLWVRIMGQNHKFDMTEYVEQGWWSQIYAELEAYARVI